MSICREVIPCAGADHLEIHVAEMILIAEDVGEDDHLVSLLDQPHGDTGDRTFDRHAGIHQGHAAAADRGHGGRTVGLEDLGNHPDGIGKILFRGQDGGKTAHGQVAMTDIPAGRTAQEPGLADAVRGEIIMQHEAVVLFARQGLHPLLIPLAAQGGGHQGLGLAAGEQGRTMGHRQVGHLTADRPDLIELSAIDANLLVDDIRPA